MEPILIISNLMLVGLTGTYAWLTNKNIKQLQQESEYYRSVVEKQLKQSALPHLYWDLQATAQPTDSTSTLTAEQSTEQLAEQLNGQVAGQLTGQTINPVEPLAVGQP